MDRAKALAASLANLQRAIEAVANEVEENPTVPGSRNQPRPNPAIKELLGLSRELRSIVKELDSRQGSFMNGWGKLRDVTN